MKIDIVGLQKSFGRHAVVRGVDLSVAEGEFVVILGPSGCGKTTTLRCLAGLEEPDQGEIRIGPTTVFSGHRSVFVPPEKRNIGMIFQSYALWPHMTVFENVAFPLRARRKGGTEIRRRVLEVLALVGLDALAERSASLLSGGQMQRVALARALASEPAALLLDEPLSNLDLKLRQRLRVELREIQQKSGATAVFVTHDQSEAAALGDRIIVMKDGNVVQDSTPEELFSRPADRFVADFLGIPNLFPFKILAQINTFTWRGMIGDGIELVARPPSGVSDSDPLWVWFRPEAIRLLDGGEKSEQLNRFSGRIISRSFTGTDYLYDAAITSANGSTATVTLRATQKLEAGEAIHLGLKDDEAHLMPEQRI